MVTTSLQRFPVAIAYSWMHFHKRGKFALDQSKTQQENTKSSKQKPLDSLYPALTHLNCETSTMVSNHRPDSPKQALESNKTLNQSMVSPSLSVIEMNIG